jgi:3-oxoacyl-[acyl-carrier protein] reductase
MFKNKTVLITGANGDIGRSLVEAFEKKNAKIICLIKKKNKEFFNFIENKNNIKFIVSDLKDDAKLSSEINKFFSKNKNLDILINNAGKASGSIIEMTSQKNLKEIFDINFFSQIKITQLLLKYLKVSKNASIINIGSIASEIPDRGTLAYGCSKLAFMHATKIMANEFSNYNIRVNGINPNVTNSKMSKQMDISAKEKLINNSYLKRACEPKEIAELAIFLSSKKSTYINGQIININGGMNW